MKYFIGRFDDIPTSRGLAHRSTTKDATGLASGFGKRPGVSLQLWPSNPVKLIVISLYIISHSGEWI